MTPKRYGIYLASLDPVVGAEISKTRPVVVVSQDGMNRLLETVVVCPLTTQIHPLWRSRVQTQCGGKAAEIAVDQIRTISKRRLVKRVDEIRAAEAEQVRQMIVEMYGAA